MVCHNCGAQNAVVHLTQVVDKEMKTLHLCERCAAEKGVEPTAIPENFPLTDLLAQMGHDERVPKEGGASASCSFCALTFTEFKESGRLGCPHCWSTFEGPLRSLLRRIHGGSQHLGKVYLSPDPSVSEREKRMESLRRKLHRAVELEDFERAAELRDEIRSMEPA
ncbi:MAG: UvrB/UvrC motif-containing protein [Gemmatimonadota bacterium]